MDPHSHYLQQTVYLATASQKPVEKTDYWKILSWASTERVRDTGENACGLEPWQDTPSYDP